MSCCAVEGCESNDLHKHHIQPVVYDVTKRRRKKVNQRSNFDKNKTLGECSFTEVFSYMFTLGCVSQEGTINLCNYHHNIMHGLIQFNKNEYSTMIKAGIARAVANGVKIGRPTNLTPEIESDVVKDRKLGHSIRSLARKYSIGTGTVYKILGKHNV